MITEKIFDVGLKHQVACRPGGEGLMACFACGVCTAGCPVSEVESRFNPRRIIHQTLIGDRESLLRSKEIWMCIGCYTCTAHCPQDVEFTNLLKVLRSMAVEEGYVSREWLAIVEEIDRRTQALRRDLIEHLIDAKRTGSMDEFDRYYQSEIGKLAWERTEGEI
ncbi:MAG TPA: 4Fe-4S dicluster domain-containing protein [Atribacteraceae bacterium]|nr:4Fe-4S dicluster domain-containing protein [Atribacteraceae bacterium]